MDKWKEDEARHRSHKRGQTRRLTSSLRTLLVVVGWVSLAAAAFLALATINKQPSIRRKLLAKASYFGGGGVLSLLLHGVFFALPEYREVRRALGKRSRDRRRDRSGSPSGAPTSAGDPRSGMSTVFVLIMLALIATLVVEAQIMARARLRRSQATADMSALRRAATETARAALQRLADDPDLRVDATNDNWAAAEVATTPDGIATEVTVEDESARFDLNNLAAPGDPAGRGAHEVTLDLFSACGEFSVSAYVSALQDWVDHDDEGFRESLFYARHAPPYAAPGRVLYGWAELLAVDGGRREWFERRRRTSTLQTFNANLLDCATVIPMSRTRPLPLNINTAPPAALQAVLGLGQDALARAIVTLRALKPIRSLELLATVAEPGVFEALRPYLDVRSRHFTIEASATQAERSFRLRALAARDPAGNVSVLQWIF